MCARASHARAACGKPHAAHPLAWVVWLGTQRFVPHGATKSKRDSPTYVGLCVCVGGGGGGSCPSPHLPCLAQGTGRMGAAKAAAIHAILSLTHRADQRSPVSTVTKGQPIYLFGPNHDWSVSLAQGQRPGFWHRFNRATRHQQALWSCMRIQNQTSRTSGGITSIGFILLVVHLDLLAIFAKSRTSSVKYRIRSPFIFPMLWSETF